MLDLASARMAHRVVLKEKASELTSILGASPSEIEAEEEPLQAQREAPLTVKKVALGVFLGMELFSLISAVLWGIIYLATH